MNTISKPRYIFQKKTWQWMADDIRYHHRIQYPNQGQLTDEEDLLQGNGKSLRSFSAMPYPIGHAPEHVGNKLIHEELDYNKETLQHDFNSYYSSLTGTRKTFMWKTLASTIQSKGDILLTVASSGIASLLLPKGKTTRSKFVIPVSAIASSTCNIHQGSDLDTNSNHLPFGGKVVVFGGDFRQILPVVPKGSRFDIVHAAINSSYLWNHCQVLRLTKNMCLQNSSENTSSSYLRAFFKWLLDIGDGILGEPNDGYAEITIPDEFLINDYNNPLEAIVNTTYPNLLQFYNNPEYLNQEPYLPLQLKLLIKSMNEKEYYSVDSINKSDALQNPTFETITPEFLNSLNTSGIPNHKMKLKVGTLIMLLQNMTQKDGLCNGTRLIISRLGAHIIEAKIIFEKNIGHKTYIPRRGLICNRGTKSGTKLSIYSFCYHLMMWHLLRGTSTCHVTSSFSATLDSPCGNKIDLINRTNMQNGYNLRDKITYSLIPRMNMSPLESPWPFKLIRRQFPFMVSFAMSINKSQGQSLSHVGLYLPRPIFSHGQLYVTLSRVQSKQGLHILIHDQQGKPCNTTINMVYKEVFQNL
ncbi:ATP-dependent DNA helicase PIF1 [Glycine max]|nr:ATP-dependent DNA helicase PIF1 [Glycine max]